MRSAVRLLLSAAVWALPAVSAFGSAVTVNTVGAYDPLDTNPSLTISDAASNALTNGISLANFKPLVSSAFANDTGGVWNGEPGSGASGDITMGGNYGDGAANAITANYGTSESHTLNFYRSDGSGGFSPNNNTSNLVISGQAYIGFSTAAEPTITFSQGLSALGFTMIGRGASRTVTLTATLDDATTIVSSAETIDSSNAPGPIFFGFTAPAGRTIVSLKEHEASNGFVRFDDLGFVVAPEPGSIGVLALSAIGLVRRRRA